MVQHKYIELLTTNRDQNTADASSIFGAILVFATVESSQLLLWEVF